jgi:lysophospholipase L1-like esterase
MLYGSTPGVMDCGPPPFYAWRYRTGTQLGDAVRFLRRHRGQVRLVTIDIGANDIQHVACDADAGPTCVADSIERLRANVAHIMRRLRRVAPHVPIVGMTYYNPFAAQWFTGIAGQVQAISTSNGLRAYNEMLRSTFEASGATVADVAAAFSTYDFTTMVDTPAGRAPLAAVRICQWTWTCAPAPDGPDIHPNDKGYGVIADAFAAALPGRVRP